MNFHIGQLRCCGSGFTWQIFLLPKTRRSACFHFELGKRSLSTVVLSGIIYFTIPPKNKGKWCTLVKRSPSENQPRIIMIVMLEMCSNPHCQSSAPKALQLLLWVHFVRSIKKKHKNWAKYGLIIRRNSTLARLSYTQSFPGLGSPITFLIPSH